MVSLNHPLPTGIAVNEMNVGVSLSEPDTLCFSVSGELDNGSSIMQPSRKDGKALRAGQFSPPAWVRTWRRLPPGRGWRGSSHSGAASSHPPVVLRTSENGENDPLMTFATFSSCLFLFNSEYVIRGRHQKKENRNQTRTEPTFFFFLSLSTPKMRKRFQKDPENGKKVWSSAGPDLSKIGREGATAAEAWFLSSPLQNVGKWG